MGRECGKPCRARRSDSLRNREALLLAAREVFSSGRADASLEAVARKAGLGIGTLYRHFPTRDALFQAVYRREVDQLVDLAGQLSREAEPLEALRLWLRASVRMVATKLGLLAALSPTPESSEPLFVESWSRMTAAAADLMARAAAENRARGDVPAEDLLCAVLGMCHVRTRPDWQAGVFRLIDLLLDGLALPGS